MAAGIGDGCRSAVAGKNNTKPHRIETLDDGSWLAELRRNNAKLDSEHVVVRVVSYDVDDGRNVEAGPFR